MLCDKLKAFVSYTEAMTSATKIRRTRRTWSFHVIVCKDNREKYRDLWRKSAATALLINSLFGGVLAIFAAVVASGLWYCYLIWTKKQSWKQLCNIDCRGGMRAIKVYVVIVFVQKHQTQTPKGILHNRRAQSSKTSNPQKPYRCLIAIFFLIKTSRYTSSTEYFLFSNWHLTVLCISILYWNLTLPYFVQ